MKDWMQLLTIVAVVITGGWFATVITQILKRPTWPSGLKLVLAIVVSALVGVATVWLAGGLTDFIHSWGHLTAAQVFAVAALVYAAAATWYHRYFAATAWMQALAYWPAKSPQAPVAVQK